MASSSSSLPPTVPLTPPPPPPPPPPPSTSSSVTTSFSKTDGTDSSTPPSLSSSSTPVAALSSTDPIEAFSVWVAGGAGDGKAGANAKTESEWKAVLSEHEYRILRQAETDRPDRRAEATTGAPASGVFVCKACYKAACLTPLYTAHAKFQAHCGWPAFDKCLRGAVVERADPDGVRVEMVCAACNGHLGHVFRGEKYTATDTRHCVNNASIRFLPRLSRRLFAALSSSTDPEAAAAIANTPLV